MAAAMVPRDRTLGRHMHDLVADWKRWSRAERVGAMLAVTGAFIAILSLPLFAG
jgi:hypothetical protein